MIPKIAGWKKNRVSELTEIFNRDGSLRKSETWSSGKKINYRYSTVKPIRVNLK